MELLLHVENQELGGRYTRISSKTTCSLSAGLRVGFDPSQLVHGTNKEVDKYLFCNWCGTLRILIASLAVKNAKPVV